MLISVVMKQRSTTLVTSGILTKFALVAAAVLMSVATPLALMPKAQADQYDDKINALKGQVNEFQTRAGELRQQAYTLQNELNRLAAEKATIQTQIDLSQATYEKLVIDIKDNEQKIADNKEGLGEIIADIQVDEDISPLEMIASSNNIAEYVDKQSYRSSISDNLQQTIDEIAKLKKENEQKKIDVERVLADQKTQREALAAKEAESQGVLAQTRGEEAAYQQMSAAKNSEITKLQAQQAAELAARARSYGGGYSALPGDGSRGGYPSQWASAPMNAYVDNWGMYTRQCVSYTAFKVQQAYGNMPYWGGKGNAHEWDDNARAMGIKVSSVPAAGTVAILNDGSYGHAAWVESVNGDGTINISHYNVGWRGEYAEWNNLSPRYFDSYIYFGG
jgi:surface antigen